MDAIKHFTELSKINFLPNLGEADIHKKAEILQDLIEKYFYSESGLMYSLLLIDGEYSVRPMTPEEVQSQNFHKFGEEHLDRCLNQTEGKLYENTIATAGKYLNAQVSRYRFNKEPAAMNEALKAFNCIKMIYEWNKKAGRPGYFSKPYGQIATRTSTPDQYVFLLTGLYWFYKLDDCPVKDEIERIFVDSGEYCMKVNYQLCDFTAWVMHKEYGAYNSIYMLISFLAYMVSKDDKFLNEMNRLAALGFWRKESYMGQWKRAGLKRMLMFERISLAFFPVLTSEIFYNEIPSIFGKTPKEQEKNMADCMYEWWRFGSLGADADFYQNYWVDIDVENYSWRSTGLTPLKPKEEMPKGLEDYFFMRYYSDVKFPPVIYRELHSSFVLYNHAPDSAKKEEALRWMKAILEKTNGQRIRWMVDLDGKQLLPENKFHACILDSEAPFHYLNIYWRARAQGII